MSRIVRSVRGVRLYTATPVQHADSAPVGVVLWHTCTHLMYCVHFNIFALFVHCGLHRHKDFACLSHGCWPLYHTHELTYPLMYPLTQTMFGTKMSTDKDADLRKQ